MQVRIATIVPIHNELEATRKFVSSYYNSLRNSQPMLYSELIIVDDGSTDGSSQWISKFDPEITVLEGTGNQWWSGSVNMALKHIESREFTHFLLFNNDNIIEENFFLNLIHVIQEVGKDKIISSKVINMYPTHHVIYGGILFDRKRSKYIKNKDVDSFAVVNTAGGMGVLIPMSVIREVGFFDEVNFPQKSADTDFYLRAEEKGMSVHYHPYLIVYNDNRISGYSSNRSIQGMKYAYSFPKGYMNVRVDSRLFFRHGNFYWSLYEIIKKNILFLLIGMVRIIKNAIKKD